MESTPTDRYREMLDDLMRLHGLTTETKLYRYTRRRHLTPTDEDGVFTITAREDASEAVSDVYSGGYIKLVTHVGQGLAFTESLDNEWRDPERIEVEVRLADVLAQGGRLYPVESVITDQVWYCTLPSGNVRVKQTG